MIRPERQDSNRSNSWGNYIQLEFSASTISTSKGKADGASLQIKGESQVGVLMLKYQFLSLSSRR